ncbi:DUF4349 domain-containing protein [Xanthomonas citri pv. glycines]|uniref:DUF4349 domain-containing protein n=1 Tax=Xanthomonas campestris pv. glycines TaxID=473421 RepID=A0AAX0I0Q4_XANCG|nr:MULTISPECIES: DUF4349 domain-containing protein [Xanthomonas]AOY62422.1 DUF4349 domain-containing protein [Xanthomonas citri pv. glycines str. 8ra]ARV23870.1 hypothetical protein A9D66_15015 [Xanthomonas citri pv. glycines str. 12-2]EWC51997.1 hypothetical protein XAR_1295 [Xanthomonas citri pv. glycines str. 8ra]OEY90312.1 hypothetical protein BIY41_15005 [Xanthomonas citri pv. glycines]OOX04005.1 hypothetical protein Xgly_10765 [Xanthomonas citri pv. glycines]
MSRAMQRYATAMLLGWALCGCAKHRAEMAADGGAAAPAPPAAQGNALAYEHDVRIELPADQIGQRIAAIRTACQGAQFGDCALLAVEQEGGRDPSGRVSVRLAPDGIEPMVQLAGQHGDVAARSTRAEDLAQQIADTSLAQARLQKEHARLLELQQRRDLAVTDLLALSKRLAEIEAEAQQTQQQAAQQQRRVRTQLLTLNFRSTGGAQGRGEIAEAAAESGEVFSSSVAFVIRAVAALLPVAALALIAGWLLLQAWRWRVRRRRMS